MSRREHRSSRPYTSSENFEIGDKRKHRSATQTVEVLPERFVEVTFDPSTRQYIALGLRAQSRLELIDLILDDWGWLRQPEHESEAA
jgi:hypothetical protein